MYTKCMTICGSFEILFLQHFFIWSYKAVIDSLTHLFNKKFKDKRKKDACKEFFFLFLTPIFSSFSMKTHECYFAYLTYLIIRA